MENIPKKNLRNELLRLSKNNPPTQKEMNRCGKYDVGTYRRNFGSWNNALEEAGLEVNVETDISKENLRNELLRLSKKVGSTPLRKEMDSEGNYSSATYERRFGSWNNALEEAGLEVNIEHNTPKEKLLDELRRLSEKLGKTPTHEDVTELGKPYFLTAWDDVPFIRETDNEPMVNTDE